MPRQLLATLGLDRFRELPVEDGGTVALEVLESRGDLLAEMLESDRAELLDFLEQAKGLPDGIAGGPISPARKDDNPRAVNPAFSARDTRSSACRRPGPPRPRAFGKEATGGEQGKSQRHSELRVR